MAHFSDELPAEGDPRPMGLDEVDFEGWFDPARVEHVRHLCGMFGPNLTRSIVAGFLVSWGRSERVSVNLRSKSVVDLAPVAEAKGRLAAATEAFERERDAYRLAVRQCYRDGATAVALAGVLGLSVVRVQQLVAGARAEV